MHHLSRLSCLAALLVTACSDDQKKEAASDNPAHPSGGPGIAEGLRHRTVLPTEVAKSFDSQLSLPQRMELIRSLPSEISEAELNELFRTLAGPCPKDLSDYDWFVVGNEVLEVLRHRELPGLETRLADLAADHAANLVMRDYSLQHYLRLQQSRLEAVANNGKDDSKLKSLIGNLEVDTRRIFGGAHDGSGSIMGTGFMGLGALCRQLNEPAVAHAAARIAHDFALPLIERPEQTAGLPNIASAIQLAGLLRIPEAEEPIRRLAFNAETDASVRLNSVFAIRNYPNPQNIEALRSMARSDKPIRYVAQESLTSIEQQLSQPIE